MSEEKKPAFAKASASAKASADKSADKKWKREICAGGVVYKVENNPAFAKASASVKKTTADKSSGRSVFILLINPRSRDFGPSEDYWTFPKGKQDKEGEDLKAVAVREVREEGGVNAVIEDELGYVKYFRNWQGDAALKFVHYFLMKYTDGDPKNHDQEVAAAVWYELEEAEKNLKFKTDKEIFAKAKQILDSKF